MGSYCASSGQKIANSETAVLALGFPCLHMGWWKCPITWHHFKNINYNRLKYQSSFHWNSLGSIYNFREHTEHNVTVLSTTCRAQLKMCHCDQAEPHYPVPGLNGKGVAEVAQPLIKSSTSMWAFPGSQRAGAWVRILPYYYIVAEPENGHTHTHSQLPGELPGVQVN